MRRNDRMPRRDEVKPPQADKTRVESRIGEPARAGTFNIPGPPNYLADTLPTAPDPKRASFKGMHDDVLRAVSEDVAPGISRHAAKVMAEVAGVVSAVESSWGEVKQKGGGRLGMKDFKNGVKQKTQELLPDGTRVKVEQPFYAPPSGVEEAKRFVRLIVKDERYAEVKAAKTTDEALAALSKSPYSTMSQHPDSSKKYHKLLKGTLNFAKRGFDGKQER